MADDYPIAGPGLPTSPEELRVGPPPPGTITGQPMIPVTTPSELRVAAPAPGTITGEPMIPAQPPGPSFGTGGVSAGGTATLGAPSPAGGGGGAGGMAGVPEIMPEIPGQGLGAGGGAVGVAPEISPEQAVELRAGAVLGETGVQQVRALREQGVPDDVIRQRLGMGPAPAAPGEAPIPPRPTGGFVGGMGGGTAPPALPEELQRPYETLYPPDYESRVAAAAVAGEISPEQARQMMRGFEAWQKSPLGIGAAEQARQRDVAEQAGELEQQAAAAQQQAAQRAKALLDQQRAEQEAQANEQRAWQEDYDREMADQTARYESAIEEAKRARIDPDRARMPIVDSLAIAMAQFAAIMTGTPNAALQIINQRLDRDIAAQERGIRTLEGNVAARQNRLGLLRQRFGDQNVARQAEKRLQLEQVTTELQRVATESKVEQNRIGAEKLALALDNQIQEMKAQEQAQHAVASQQLAAMRSAARIGAANRLAAMREMQETGMGPWQTRDAGKMQARYVPGFGFAASPAAAKEVRDNLSKFDTTIGAFEKLLKIAEVPGAATSPEMRARATSLLSQADLGLAVANQLGAISASDAEFVQNQRGNPTALTDIGAKTRLKQTLGDLRANRRMALARHHFVPGEVGTTMHKPKRGEPAVPAVSYRLAVPGAQTMQPGATAIPETELAP